jgi:2-polyprenyl-3-methyl-5-hydroxy-6-metoxy-1,4-benzoquinol methylase
MNCPLCRKEFKPWLTLPSDWRRPTQQASYRLLWCSRCHFGQLAPRPDPETIASFYAIDDYYTHAAQNGTAKTTRSWAQRLKTHLAWRVDQSVELNTAWIRKQLGEAPKEICDLGCGSGDLLCTIRDAGHRVTGVEPDPAARTVAGARQLEVLPGTAEALPAELSGRRFDAVVMSHVLEHCHDPLAALRNARALLKPGGRLIVETPNNAARGMRSAGLAWYWLDVPRHLNFFTPQSLKSCFEAAGLHVEATEFRGYARQFAAAWIASEQLIWDRLNAAAPRVVSAARNSEWKAWRLLFTTAFARAAEKYDSVRLIATA